MHESSVLTPFRHSNGPGIPVAPCLVTRLLSRLLLATRVTLLVTRLLSGLLLVALPRVATTAPPSHSVSEVLVGRRGRRSLPSPCGWHPQLVAFAASCGSVASTVTRPCLATPTASAAGIAQPGRITTVAGGFPTAGYACYLSAALPHLTELLTPTLRGRPRQTRCC